jgi:hypothetical protein
MSALGQKQTLDWPPLMSALPPKADIGTQSRNVRFVPIADICTAANSPYSITSSAQSTNWQRHFGPHREVHHSGNRIVGPMSAGEGRPGVGGCGASAGGRRAPQLVRARISSFVATVTKELSSRICHPPPSAR